MSPDINVGSLPIFVVGIATGSLGFFVLVREHASRVSVAFFAVSVSVAVWLASFLLVFSSGDNETALLATRLVGAAGISFIPSTVFIFALEISGYADTYRPFGTTGLVISALLYFVGATTPWTITSVYSYSWGFYPSYGPLSYFYLAFFALLMGWSVILLVRQYRRARTPRQRRRMALLLTAAGIASIACIDFLPVFGLSVYPIGYLAVFGCLAVVSRVITRYRFVDITPSEMAGQIMDSMTDGLAVIDTKGVVRLSNDAAMKMFRSDMINKKIASIPVVRSRLEDLRRSFDERKPRVLEVTDDESDKTFSLSTSVVYDLQADPFALLLVSRDISERVEYEQSIKRQTEDLAALHAIDIAITGGVDLRLTLDVLTQKVVDRLEVDAVAVLLYDERANLLRFVAGQGVPQQAGLTSPIDINDELIRRVVLERQTVERYLTPALTESSSRLQALADAGIRTYHARPLIAKGRLNAVLETFHFREFHADEHWLAFYDALAEQAAIAIDNGALFQELQRSNSELRLAYDNTLEGWALALELRDVETQGHSRRVSEFSIRLAESLGVGGEELVNLRRGALLHDIGKMGIPDSILFKSGALDDEEWKLMQTHPTIAFEMLKRIPFLRSAIDIPYCHHEKWNGRGYPRGLYGEQIPVAARIFSVVDVWDALRTRRSYHDPWPADRVRDYLQSRSGADFDPEVISRFLSLDPSA